MAQGKSPVKLPIQRDVNDLFEREARRAIRLLDDPLLRRTSVKSVTLGATTVKVKHQLGKIPTGWLVSDKTASADVWRDATVPSTADYIALKATGTVTVDLIFW
jgi:hypothetical protein